MFGIAFLKWWFLSKDGRLYYFEFPNLQFAFVFFIAALLGACTVLYRYLWHVFAGLLAVPVFLLLAGMIFFS
jgi:hypothetical protein